VTAAFRRTSHCTSGSICRISGATPAQRRCHKIEEFYRWFLERNDVSVEDKPQQRGTVNHTSDYPDDIDKHALDLGMSMLIRDPGDNHVNQKTSLIPRGLAALCLDG
jgi:hypothetical protein